MQTPVAGQSKSHRFAIHQSHSETMNTCGAPTIVVEVSRQPKFLAFRQNKPARERSQRRDHAID